MWLAIQLERKYTKEEIFEMYVNKIFFANRANGILTASQTYYGKDLKRIEIERSGHACRITAKPKQL